MEFRADQGWFPGLELPYLALYLPTMFVLLGAALGLLLWRFKKTEPSLERQNLVIMLAAIGLAFGLSLTGLLRQISALMPLAPLTYVVIISYALTRRRLLDLNVLVREGVFAALGSLLLTALVALLIMGVLNIFGVALGLKALFLSALLFALLYPLQVTWTRGLFGRWLGRDVGIRQGLLDYSLLAGANPAFDGLMRASLERLVREHGLSRACLLLMGQGQGVLSVFAAYPDEGIKPEPIEADSILAKMVLGASQGLDADSLGWTQRYEKKSIRQEGDEAVRSYLESARMQACFGLVLRGRLRGVLLVGPPASARALLARELDFFSALAGQMAGMAENAVLEGQVQHADRLSTLGMLAASVAHEIRNPLASIGVFVHMLPQRHGDPEFMEKFSRVVGAEMRKLNRLSDDMMNLARPATQAHRVVDLGLLCERERVLIEQPFRKQQVKLRVMVPEGVLVQGEETRLSQVLLNLLLNALEVSPRESTVSVELLRLEHEAELRIRDEGPGLAPQQMRRLFEPFFTTKEGGHGLGLATSRRIVESFGGRLEAANAPGGGAEFTVRLPLAPALVEEVRATA